VRFNFVHISDVHFQPGGFEKRPAFKPFLDDLADVVSGLQDETFLVLSGDVAQSGSDRADYDALFDLLDPLLCEIGITKSHRICVPGNHDVSRSEVEKALFDHEGVIAMGLDESGFNRYVERPSEVYRNKFKNYLEFQRRFATFGISEDSLGGVGHSLNDELGVYCCNTAFLSSAGAMHNGSRISDKGRLALATAALASWLNSSKHNLNLLVAHHPVAWLNQWSQQEIGSFEARFDAMFTGHEHEADAREEVRSGSRLLRLAAPALLTDKREPMAYSVTTLDASGTKRVLYRQWDKRGRFVLGTLLSGNDTGVSDFSATIPSTDARALVASRYFDEGLKKTLQAFGRKNGLKWVEPEIFDRPEAEKGRGKATQVSVEEIVRFNDSIVIKAAPQFGLTALGWQLCKTGVETQPNQIWLRVDLAVTKPHSVRDDLKAQMGLFGGTHDGVCSIVVDSWNPKAANPEKCIGAIRKEFPNARLLILEAEHSPSFGAVSVQIGGLQLKQFYLWAFGRSGLRSIVRSYCAEREIDADVEALLGRVLQDMHALNLPRTALNCLTILMVSASEGDPLVNRAEVIKGILTIIFQSDASLTYRSRADLKDCEHLLGSFAEKIIRSGDQLFSREQFLTEGRRFCKEMLVDVDVLAVLQLLLEHDIIVIVGDTLCFRFTYWVYYFAAARMYHDAEFRQFILRDMQYTRFPEVIEFYAGIDRCRDDALSSLTKDLTALHHRVEAKTQLSSPGKLYALFNWSPAASDADRMMKHLEGEVLRSSLPQEVKDQFADRVYDASRPYDQQIRSLLETYSFDNLSAGLRASARALRNSDYVRPQIKEELLDALLGCWEQVQSVLVVISPILAEQGEAIFDGTRFVLDDELKDDESPAVAKIWNVIPFNVLMWFRDDLTSAKMGPLLYKRLKTESDPLRKHNVALLVAAIRPLRWQAELEDYVAGINKNSFYLYDLATFLTIEFRYAYLTSDGANDVARFVKMAYSKHVTGNNRPSDHMISKVQVPALLEDPGEERA
jgi:hypothetical protein